MKLPILELSSDLVEGVPYSSNLSEYKGYVYGGPTLGTSDGFKVLVKWDYEYDRVTGTLKTWREDLPDVKYTVFTIPDVYDVSFCFNKSMNFVCAYVDRSGSKLYYYDPTISDYISQTLPDAITPRVALSSVHSYHSYDSEIVLGYMKGDNELYIKLEGERFQVEHLVKKFPTKTKLMNISFADSNRFQYEVLEAV